MPERGHPAAKREGASVNTGVTLGRLIADAHNVAAASHKHWEEMKKFGAKEANLRLFEKTIDDAQKISLQIVPEIPVVEEIRAAMKDGLGRYRMCADLICNPMARRDTKLEREMRIGNTFPRNDTQLHAYTLGLDAIIRKHSARLAENGFGKAEQALLVSQMAEYLKLLAVRGKERGKVRAERVKREAILDNLRAITSYFRRVGRAALIGEAARADFDRVAGVAKKKAIAPAPDGDADDKKTGNT
jgi:hypothetical protein